MTQTIINLGTGGAALNGQNGSTASADSNDALFLDWPGDNGGNYVYLPGVSENAMSVPDEAALDITGDLDLRLQLSLDDWTPTAERSLLSKWDIASNRSFFFRITSSSNLNLVWSEDGTATKAATSTAALTVSDGESLWVRVTLDVNNGSSGNDVTFFTSIDGISWSQLGSVVTQATATSIYSSSTNVIVGSTANNAGNPAGKFYRAQVLNGIGGTTVLDVDTSVITSGSATSFTALTGQTVTINRSTAGRKAVAVVSPVWLLGTDDYMEVADNALLDFGTADSFTVLAVVRQWATPASFQRYIAKADLTTAGYALLNNATNNRHYLSISDGSNNSNSSLSVNNFTVGAISVLGGIRDTTADTIRHFLNTTLGTAYTDTTTGSLANTGPLRIGSSSPTAGAYSDMELVAAAVFRRALTSTEITQISDYYQARLS